MTKKQPADFTLNIYAHKTENMFFDIKEKLDARNVVVKKKKK